MKRILSVLVFLLLLAGIAPAQAVLSGGTRARQVSWSTATAFDQWLTIYAQHTMSADITLTKTTSGAKAGYGAIKRIVADGSHTVTYSAFKETIGSAGYDNRSGIVNVAYFVYDGTDYWISWSQELNQTPLDITAPTLSSATVEDANKDKIVLTYNESLDTGSVPATGDFSVSGGKSVSSVAIAGAVVTLTVSSAYAYGNTITVSYTKGSNPIQDASGNNAGNLSSQSVTNNISAPASEEAIAWTSASNATISGADVTSTAGSGAAYAIGTKKIAGSANGYVQFTYQGSAGDSAGIGFDVDTTDPGGVSKFESYNITFYTYGGTNSYYAVGASVTALGFAPTTNMIYRLERSGSNILLKTSTDGGSNFTTRATIGSGTHGINSGTDIYVKASIYDSGKTLSTAKIYNGVTYP